jgi:hypothetical protein
MMNSEQILRAELDCLLVGDSNQAEGIQNKGRGPLFLVWRDEESFLKGGKA